MPTRSRYDVDSDPEFIGRSGEQVSDITLRAEPQRPAMGESGGQGLSDEPPGAAIAGGNLRGLIEQRSWVNDLEDLGVGVTDGIPIS